MRRRRLRGSTSQEEKDESSSIPYESIIRRARQAEVIGQSTCFLLKPLSKVQGNEKCHVSDLDVPTNQVSQSQYKVQLTKTEQLNHLS